MKRREEKRKNKEEDITEGNRKEKRTEKKQRKEKQITATRRKVNV